MNSRTSPKELRPEVLLGLDLGWEMALISADSHWASTALTICPPTSDRSILEYWFGRYHASSFVLRTGVASNVVAVSFHVDLAREALEVLSQQSHSWSGTLQFRTKRSLYFLFRHPGIGFRPAVRSRISKAFGFTGASTYMCRRRGWQATF
ncbi:MAG: bifunctional DNA primase/polymerase [Terracidiphilus sp.]